VAACKKTGVAVHIHDLRHCLDQQGVESDILEVEFFDFFRLFHAPTISLQSVLRGQIDCADRDDKKSLRHKGDTEIRVPFSLQQLCFGLPFMELNYCTQFPSRF
jgi:hypothetical protein